MTSAWLTQRNVDPALLCSEPVGTSLPTRQLTRNNDRLGPMHLSRYGPVDCRRQFKIDHLCQLNFDQGSNAGCLAPGCG